MRDLLSQFIADLQKDKVSFLHLVEIRLRSGNVLRLALNPTAVSWNGSVWSPTSGFWGEVQESAERDAPTLHFLLQNMDGVLGPVFDPNAGGADERGSRVILYRTLRSHLLTGNPGQSQILDALFLEDYQWVGTEHLALHLSLFPATMIQVPWRTLQGSVCVVLYKGEHCGYAGPKATCDKSAFGPDGCKAHFPDEPLRFGAFWVKGMDTRGVAV